MAQSVRWEMIQTSPFEDPHPGTAVEVQGSAGDIANNDVKIVSNGGEVTQNGQSKSV